MPEPDPSTQEKGPGPMTARRSTPLYPRADCLSRPELKARGWTDGLIRRFLLAPDDTRANPRYVSAPPMPLYLRSRVEVIEATAEFQGAAMTAGKRKAAARRAVETKLERLRRELDAIRIEVPRLGRNALIRRACAHYNDRKAWLAEERGDWDWRPAMPDSDRRFLDRIAVNFLRHALTDYDDHLAAVAGRVGVDLAAGEIARRVFAAIEATYPDLAGECQRQLEVRAIEAGMKSAGKREA